MCKEDFYYRIQNKTCVEVPTEEKIENCSFYDSATKCTDCSKGYYMSGSKCLVATELIENCIEPVEGNLKECARCAVGKLLTTDGTECKDPPAEDCSSFKNVQCLKCKPNYLLNPNQYLTSIDNYLSDNKGKVILEMAQKELVLGGISSLSSQVCSAPKVLNCFKYKTFEECEKCSASKGLFQIFMLNFG